MFYYCLSIIYLYVCKVLNNIIMKKIKILHGFLISLIILYIAYFYSTLFIMPKVLPVSIYEETFFGIPKYYLLFSFSILLFLGLVFTQISLFFIIKNGFFNNKSSSLLKKGGFLILISGLLNFIIGIILLFNTKEDNHINSILHAVSTLLIGFGLIILSDFVKKGGVLKHENELTI